MSNMRLRGGTKRGRPQKRGVVKVSRVEEPFGHFYMHDINVSISVWSGDVLNVSISYFFLPQTQKQRSNREWSWFTNVLPHSTSSLWRQTPNTLAACVHFCNASDLHEKMLSKTCALVFSLFLHQSSIIHSLFCLSSLGCRGVEPILALDGRVLGHLTHCTRSLWNIKQKDLWLKKINQISS